MPGAIYNPLLNPQQSYAQYSNDYDPTSYQRQVDRGYSWNGTGWDYVGGGTQATDAMKKFGVPMGDAKDGYFGLGGGGAPGVGGAGGATSLATGGSVAGGGFSANAQLAQLNSQFDQMLNRGMGQLNEAAALSGGFSGGIPFENRQRLITDTNLQRGAGIERIMNDLLGRQHSYELEQRRLADEAKARMYGSGSQRYSGYNTGGNQTQDVYNYYSSKKSGSGGGGTTVITDPMGGATPGGAGGSTSAGPSRRESSSSFYKTYGRWPTPDELDAFMSGSMGAYNPTTDQSMAYPGTSVFG